MTNTFQGRLQRPTSLFLVSRTLTTRQRSTLLGWSGPITLTCTYTRTHTHVIGVGWGGLIKFACTHACHWGGVGLANNVLVHLHAHTHTSCYASGRSLALAHARHIALVDNLLHLLTHTHMSCYASGRSLALAHTRHATLQK